MSKEKNISIDYLFRTTWQCINKMYNEEADKHGSTMTVGFVLVNIDYNKGTPSTTLGPKMGIEPTSLSRTLKKMEADDLIYREKNPLDGRSVMIKLTKKGKEQRETSKQTILQFNAVVEQNLTEAQIESFRHVSETIKELINNKMIF